PQRHSSLAPSWAGQPSRAYYRLPAGERRTSEGRTLGASTTEDRRDPRREAGGFCWLEAGVGRPAMTMTKGATAKTPRPTAPGPGARRSHVRGDGTSNAAAVEQARKSMLDESRPRNRTRIGADVVCEALLRQGVDVFFSYPGGVILPLYDILGDYPELRHI